MPPFLLIEPESSAKRRRFSGKLIGKKTVSQASPEDIRKRLRDIRNYSISHINELAVKLERVYSQNPNITLTRAKDNAEAINQINKISQGMPIAVSKSAVVHKELLPGLVQSGHRVIETYFDQFESFENPLGKSASKASVGLEAVPESFHQTADLAENRRRSILERGRKKVTGLMGVNAVSADNGSVFLLQHTHNISDIFEQAGQLVLVAGMDKIVANAEEAEFVTKCMGIFGWGTIPKNIHGKINSEIKIDEMPFDIAAGRTAGKIHLILLDNGRSEILKSYYRDLISCIGCRACSKDCPTLPFSEDDTPWNPREYLYYHVTGSNPSLELCLQCKSCKSNCPLDIDLPGMILESRAAHFSMKLDSITDNALSNFETIAKLGHTVPFLADVALNNGLFRWLGEKSMGISREMQLPKFQRMTFARWFKSYREKS